MRHGALSIRPVEEPHYGETGFQPDSRNHLCMKVKGLIQLNVMS